MNTTHLQSLFGSALPSREKPTDTPHKNKGHGRPPIGDEVLTNSMKVRMTGDMFEYLQDQGGVAYMRQLVERDMRKAARLLQAQGGQR